MVKIMAVFKGKAPPHLRKMRKFCGLRRRSVGVALSEDAFLGDLTTASVLKQNPIISGKIICQGNGVLAGIEEAKWAIGAQNAVFLIKNGAALKPGIAVAVVRARAGVVLKRIRTSLNYLSRLSGLATNAERLSKKFGKNRLAALRKTSPGLGVSEKAALQVGGVMAHRVTLGDGVLIKKEHVTIIQRELGGSRVMAVFEATRRAVAYVKRGGLRARGVFVGVEIETLNEALWAARAKPDIILFDNLSPKKTRIVADRIRNLDRGIIVEASGAITEETAGLYLRAGADVVSGSFVLDAKPVSFKFSLDG